MHIVEVFVPVADDRGVRFPAEVFDSLQKLMTETFGGVTIFTRAPAKGLWKDEDNNVEHDLLVIFEVMAETIDREWWAGLKDRLEKTLRQKEILIRVHSVERL
jgi:hypothetical protein